MGDSCGFPTNLSTCIGHCHSVVQLKCSTFLMGQLFQEHHVLMIEVLAKGVEFVLGCLSAWGLCCCYGFSESTRSVVLAVEGMCQGSREKRLLFEQVLNSYLG